MMFWIFGPCLWCREPTFRGRTHRHCHHDLMDAMQRMESQVSQMSDWRHRAIRAERYAREAYSLLEKAEPLLQRGRLNRQTAGNVRAFVEGGLPSTLSSILDDTTKPFEGAPPLGTLVTLKEAGGPTRFFRVDAVDAHSVHMSPLGGAK